MSSEKEDLLQMRKLVKAFIRSHCMVYPRADIPRPILDARVFYVALYFWASYTKDAYFPKSVPRSFVVECVGAYTKGKVAILQMESKIIYLCGIACKVNDCSFPRAIGSHVYIENAKGEIHRAQAGSDGGEEDESAA